MYHRILLIIAALCFGQTVQAQAPTELKGHADKVYSLSFSPDGKLLATGGFDNLIKLWSFPAGKEVRTLTGHTAPVYCVAFSPDGSTLASSSQDQTIRLWNVNDGKMVRELKGHTGIVDSVVFSPDGKLLSSGGQDKTVRLWNPADGKELKNLGSHGNSVYAVAFSPDGKLLASAGADALVKLWDVTGQKEAKTFKGHEGAVTGVLFTPDNASVLSIGLLDHYLRQWNVASGAEAKKMGPTPDDLYGIALSRDGKALVTSGYGGNVILWNLTDGKPLQTHKLKFGAYCVTFTPDGKSIITGHDNHICYITPFTGKTP
jgi:WD40 repeat protein